MDKRLLEAAEAALSSGDLDLAEALCFRLLEDSSGEATASHLLGLVALKRKDPQEAVRLIERAIEHGLINTIVLSNCGEAYRQLGRLDEAYTRFERALKADSSNPSAHFNLGLVMRSRGDAREAEHFFRNALALKPEMARAHCELAELYRQEGYWLESEREYSEAIATFRNSNTEAQHELYLQWSVRLGSLLRERGKVLQSVRLLEDVLQESQHAGAHFEIAMAKFELSWEGAALEHYMRAAHLQPTLGLHMPLRVISARLSSIKQWSESGRGRYKLLAHSHSLASPPLRVIPRSAKEGFVLGEAVTPELGCATASNAEILPHDFAVLAHDHLLVGGVINWFQHYARQGKLVRHHTDDGRVLLDLPKRTQVHDGACVLLGKANDQYAWLYGSLARLWVVDQMPDLGALPFVVSEDIPDDRLAMAGCFGITEDRLLRLGDDCSIRAREVHIPSLPVVGDWISPLALQFLRRRLGGGSSNAKRRIFLSRQGLSDRRLINETELLGELSKYGFEVVKVAETSSLELLSILREANVVIGIDDDAMANLLVCPQGARIGVIATAGAYRPRPYFICGQLAQELTYLVGETQYDSNPIHGLCDIFLPERILSAFMAEVDKSSG